MARVGQSLAMDKKCNLSKAVNSEKKADSFGL